MRSRLLRILTLAALVCSVPGAVLAQDVAQAAPAPAVEPPSTEQILYAMQDVRLPLEGLQVRNVMMNEAGGGALVQLTDGTLVDIRLAAAQQGWTVRGISLIAGSSDAFYAWSEPWRDRVAAAEDFLASADTAGVPTRTAEELAPLSWFEDPEEASRLWGMNPMTYRLLQTLQMMPVLQGPTGGGTRTNPVPRRDQ